MADNEQGGREEEMSNFRCEHCGTDILEGLGGQYITECEHYPLDPPDCENIDAFVKLGHTRHCASRIVLGDGECECRRGNK